MANPSQPRLAPVAMDTPPLTPVNGGTDRPEVPAEKQSAPPAPHGTVIPPWVLQVVPILAVIAAAIMVFAQQRTDVEIMKKEMAAVRVVQDQATVKYVEKQVLDLHMGENERTRVEMNRRFDKLEEMLQRVYDRLPPKRQEK